LNLPKNDWEGLKIIAGSYISMKTAMLTEAVVVFIVCIRY